MISSLCRNYRILTDGEQFRVRSSPIADSEFWTNWSGLLGSLKEARAYVATSVLRDNREAARTWVVVDEEQDDV